MEAGTLGADQGVCFNRGDDACLPRAGSTEHKWSIILLSLYRTDPMALVAVLIAMLVGLTVHDPIVTDPADPSVEAARRLAERVRDTVRAEVDEGDGAATLESSTA